MTDLTTTVSLSGITDFKYDDAQGVLYLTTSAGVLDGWSPTTGAFLSSISLGGTLSDLAVTPDGQYLLVSHSNTTGTYSDEIDRINISNLSVQQLNFLPGGASFLEQGIAHIAIAQNGTALATTNFGGSGSTPLRQFYAEATTLNPVGVSPIGGTGSVSVEGASYLATSSNGRYVLISEDNISNGQYEIYDATANKIISQGYGAGYNNGQEDISNSGLVVDLLYNSLVVYDRSFNVVKDFSSINPHAGPNPYTTMVGVHFSADGHQLFLWNQIAQQIQVYDTSSWQMEGAFSAPSPYFPLVAGIAGSGPSGFMQVSQDGQFLFLNNGTGFESVDLSARLHLTVTGDATHNQLYGSVGSDTITGGAENDLIYGGGGNDVIDGGGGDDTMDGGSGINTVSYASSAFSGVTVSLALQGSAQNTVGAGTDTLSNFQNLTGSAFNDTLTGDANNNVINGGAGSDRIIGGGGNDTLTGGTGSDTFVFGPGIGNSIITDFTNSDGDRIDLSALGTFQSLFDVLRASTQVGANTVIALGSGSLTLDNVQMAHLSGSNFSLPEPVYTFPTTSSYAGLYRSYYVEADSIYDFDAAPAPASGLAGTGFANVLGPSGLANNLINPQQITFVDGYLATGTSTSAAQVYRIYGATLDRQPDSEGLANWVHSLAGGMSLQTVVNGFVGSDEFQAKYGALDNTGFVTLLYSNVLDRGPDAGGLANWLSYLSQGHSRAEVVLGFSESAEYIADTALPVLQGLWVIDTGAAEVARLYDTVLGRLPDSVGEINWTHALDGGAMTLLQVTQGFVGSAEFQVVYGSVNDSQFVQLLYQNTLHRPADAQGLTNWVNYLGAGHSRAEVVQGFSESQEHINNTAAHIDHGIWYL